MPFFLHSDQCVEKLPAVLVEQLLIIQEAFDPFFRRKSVFNVFKKDIRFQQERTDSFDGGAVDFWDGQAANFHSAPDAAAAVDPGAPENVFSAGKSSRGCCSV